MRKGPLIINTRPGTQGERLHKALSQLSYETLHQPAITIEIFDDTQFDSHSNGHLEDLVNSLPDPQRKFIFVSRNAVIALAKHIDELPSAGKVYAIGPGTAEQLTESFGLPADRLIIPSISDSEGLLAEQHFHTGDKVTIFKGLRGRETLSQALSNIGAIVTECPLYERIALDLSAKMLAWPEQSIIIATSVEIVESILASAQLAQIEISNWRWIVFSDRIKQRLLNEKVEIKQIYICEQMNNSSIINTIENTQ